MGLSVRLVAQQLTRRMEVRLVHPCFFICLFVVSDILVLLVVLHLAQIFEHPNENCFQDVDEVIKSPTSLNPCSLLHYFMFC